jgi:hypothetical protein
MEIDMGQILLSPVYFVNSILNLYTNLDVSGNPFIMFLVLWISYAIPALWLAPMLMVRNHHIADLKDWYNSRTR